ncbi:hypothetical protein U9M48_020821 [Paspalum notatum var. saurae]|uniref:Uncharacterized protein n=1 Tax=Paspalum notatum var. saurae TaxID=547442 RepID=A0AAQ3TFW7_PASNO
MEALAGCSSNAALAQESGAPVLATVFFRLDQSPKGAQEPLQGFFAFAMSPMFYTSATAPRVDAAAWTTEGLGAVAGSRRPRDARGGERAGCRRGQPPAWGCARWRVRAAAAGSRWPGMRELEGAWGAAAPAAPSSSSPPTPASLPRPFRSPSPAIPSCRSCSCSGLRWGRGAPWPGWGHGGSRGRSTPAEEAMGGAARAWRSERRKRRCHDVRD